MTTDQASPSFNPEVPNAARIYDYLVGGKHNFAADRAAADYMCSLVPSTPKWLNMLRAFLGKVGSELAAQGFTHFVDFASGLPTEDHIHAVAPHAKVVYSDIDPYTLSHGQKIVANLPNVLYVRGDVRHPRQLLDSPKVQEFLGGTHKVAFGLSGISVFFAPTELRTILQELYAWAAPGSKLYLNFETKAPGALTPNLETFIDVLSQAGGPYRFYSLEDCLMVGEPWQLDEPGLVPLSQFLGLPADHITLQDREDVDLEFYAAIMVKR